MKVKYITVQLVEAKVNDINIWNKGDAYMTKENCPRCKRLMNSMKNYLGPTKTITIVLSIMCITF